MKRIALLFIAACSLALSSCHVVRFFSRNMPDVRDQYRFASAPIQKANAVWELSYARNPSFDYQQEVSIPRTKMPLEKLLKRTGTTAFIVIQGDSVITERYFDDFDAQHTMPSFSVSKSFVSALVGIALDEGKIGSVNDTIGAYMPWLKHQSARQITIKALLDMQSGVKFSELYVNPFADVVKFYYGNNLKKYVANLRASTKPNQPFRYKSVNTQLLAMVVEGAYNRPLPELVQEKLWQPMGMETSATWNLDSEKNQTPKAFCCLNAIARDYARFGLMYMNGGMANGKQIVPQSWVKATFTYDKPKNEFRYNNHFWTSKRIRTVEDTANVKGFFVLNPRKRSTPGNYHIIQQGGAVVAQGILGQTIYMRPEKDLIIVRLGKRNGWFLWANVCYQISKNM